MRTVSTDRVFEADSAPALLRKVADFIELTDEQVSYWKVTEYQDFKGRKLEGVRWEAVVTSAPRVR